MINPKWSPHGKLKASDQTHQFSSNCSNESCYKREPSCYPNINFVGNDYGKIDRNYLHFHWLQSERKARKKISTLAETK